jgi:hypothetical protein
MELLINELHNRVFQKLKLNNVDTEGNKTTAVFHKQLRVWKDASVALVQNKILVLEWRHSVVVTQEVAVVSMSLTVVCMCLLLHAALMQDCKTSGQKVS